MMIRTSITLSKSDFIENLQTKEKYMKSINDFVKKMEDEYFLEGYYFTLSNSRQCLYDDVYRDQSSH